MKIDSFICCIIWLLLKKVLNLHLRTEINVIVFFNVIAVGIIMFKKMLFAGLILILSASASLYADIAPDSVLGNFTKCTTHLWRAGNSEPRYTNDFISSAQYNQKGRISYEVSKYGDRSLQQTTKRKYDNKGDIQEVVLYNKDGELAFKMVYSASKDTFKTQRINYNNGKESVSYSYNILDNKGNVIEYFSLDRMFNNGERITKATNQYDEKNNVVLEINYENGTDLTSRKLDTTFYKYKYDDAGRLLETTKLNTGNTKEETYYNKYDNSGRIVENSFLKPDGTIEVFSFCKYEDNGFKTEYIKEISNGNYIRRIQKYDDKDRVIEEIDCNPDGVYTTKITRKYDKDRLIELVTYNPGETIKEKRTFEYDKYGNCTKDVTFSSGNEPTKTIEYAYSK